MQRSLDLDGNTFAHPGHYVPVLQDHIGERSALADLRTQTPAVLERLMPVIQILGGKTTDLSRNAIRSHVNEIAHSLGPDHPWYLDFVREDPARVIETKSGPLTVAELAYRAARRRQLAFVPVVRTWGDPGHVDTAVDAAHDQHRGLAIRHRPLGVAPTAGISPTAPVERTLAAIDLEVERIDLMLDLGYIGPGVTLTPRRMERSLRRFMALGSWRRICLIGSSMPKSLSEVGEDTEAYLPRREWDLWSSLPADLRRTVCFGDYGVQHPEPPQDAGKAMGMRANIRYTVKTAHLVARARGAVSQQGSHQYRTLCQRLRQKPDFDGNGASCGDDTVVACAEGKIPPRHQSMWRQVGTSRHLTIVSQQALDLR